MLQIARPEIDIPVAYTDVVSALESVRAQRVDRAVVPIENSIEGGVTATLDRSEEHTSELQSRGHLVCRLLLEKKNTSAREPTREIIIQHLVNKGEGSELLE